MIRDVKKDVLRRLTRDRIGSNMDTVTVRILVNENLMLLRDRGREDREMLIHGDITIMEGRAATMVASTAVAMLNRIVVGIVAGVVQRLGTEVTKEAHKEGTWIDLHRRTEVPSDGKGRVIPLVRCEEEIQIIHGSKGWRGLDQRLVSGGVATVLGKWIAVLKVNVVDEV